MTTFDYTTDPPTVRFNKHVSHLLKPQGETADEECVYDLKAIQEFTRNLMDMVQISYDSHATEGDRLLTGFSNEEKRVYYPFAFMLACLDGNAFRTGDLNAILEHGADQPPMPETICQYIPDAYRIIKANSGTLEEVRQIIGAANDR